MVYKKNLRKHGMYSNISLIKSYKKDVCHFEPSPIATSIIYTRDLINTSCNIRANGHIAIILSILYHLCDKNALFYKYFIRWKVHLKYRDSQVRNKRSLGDENTWKSQIGTGPGVRKNKSPLLACNKSTKAA